MKLVMILALALCGACSACCSAGDNDIATVALVHAAGICDNTIFPSDEQQQIAVPVGK